jgi:hypothetical protein
LLPVDPHLGPEWHGTIEAPRVKWTCVLCGRRNDTKVPQPIPNRFRVFCQGCRRSDVLQRVPDPA